MVGVAAGLLVMATAHASGGHGGKLNWVGDYDRGLAEAQRTGKPAVVYFTADW